MIKIDYYDNLDRYFMFVDTNEYGSMYTKDQLLRIKEAIESLFKDDE
jgi:hypothetical protein